MNGLRLHARVRDDLAPPGAPTAVLIHGLSVSSLYFTPTAQRLAPHCRVYAPDLPGYGRSQKPAQVPDIPELAESLAAWLDAAGIATPDVLVANSMGCQTVVEFALRYPHRARRLILVGPTYDPSNPGLLEQARRLALDLFFEPPHVTLFLIWPDNIRFGPRRTLVSFRHGQRHHVERLLPRVGAPALVVRGERDPICPQRWAEEVARLLPRGELRVVPGAAHAVNANSPEALVRLTLDVLARA